MNRILVLTGPPAVGKSTTARALATRRQVAAVVDVDDIRQLVVAGHAAPWQGAEGLRQQQLGVRNACRLAADLAEAGFDVVLSDIVDVSTIAGYRELLPGVLIIRLMAAPDDLAERAASRPMHLTPDEQQRLVRHERDDPPPVDLVLDVTGLDLDGQVAAVAASWDALADPQNCETPFTAVATHRSD